MNLDNFEVTISGIQTQDQNITIITNSSVVESNQTTNVISYDIETTLENSVVDINIENQSIVNEIEVKQENTLLNVDVNIIQEDVSYELLFQNISVSGDVSQVSDNRIKFFDDGFYVPEITLDLVSIYENAKS